MERGRSVRRFGEDVEMRKARDLKCLVVSGDRQVG